MCDQRLLLWYDLLVREEIHNIRDKKGRKIAHPLAVEGNRRTRNTFNCFGSGADFKFLLQCYV